MIESSCIIICPIYRDVLFEKKRIAIAHNRKILANYPFIFIIPNNFPLNLLEEWFDFDYEVEMFDRKFFNNPNTYNKLLKLEEFWSRFSSRNVLICQDDAWIFRDELEYWCNKNYDFIGAPLFEGYTSAKEDSDFINALNGGLSLHNVQKNLESIVTFNWSSFILKSIMKFDLSRLYHGIKYGLFDRNLNEDLFWSQYIPYIIEDYKIANLSDAIRFSFEKNPQKLYELNQNKLPFGCHGWNRYSPDFWSRFIPELFV